MERNFEKIQGNYEPITNKSERLLHRDDGDVWQDDEETHLPMQKIGTHRFNLPYSLFSAFKSTLNTVLLVVILFCFLRENFDSYRNSKLDVGGDITGWGPKVTKHLKRFAPDPAFAPVNSSEVFSDDVRQAWLGLVPRGLYVRIDDPENYDNLPTPLPQFDYPIFGTSVVHQLHCLHSILEIYSYFMSNHTLDMYLSSEHRGGARDPPTAPWHDMHCFDYLRQNIMCCGDTALEGTQTSFPDPDIPGSDGWDAIHVCKNYNEIREFFDVHRAWDIETI